MARPSLLLRTATVLGAVTLAVSGLSAPASAAHRTIGDPRGDTWRSVDGGPIARTSGSTIDSDLVSTRVTHAPRRVLWRAKFTDLDATSPDTWNLGLVMRSRTGGRWFAFVGKDDQGVSSGFYTTTVAPAACRGMRSRIDWDRNVVRGSVPRRCIGSPARFGYQIYSIRHLTTRAGRQVTWYDDGASRSYGPGTTYQGPVQHG